MSRIDIRMLMRRDVFNVCLHRVPLERKERNGSTGTGRNTLLFIGNKVWGRGGNPDNGAFGSPNV